MMESPEQKARRLHDKANEMRERGDALGSAGNRAEGQRLLRECRRLRKQAWEIEGKMPRYAKPKPTGGAYRRPR